MPSKQMVRWLGPVLLAVLALVLVSLACNAPEPSPTSVLITVVVPATATEPPDTPAAVDTSVPTDTPVLTESPSPAETSAPTDTPVPTDTPTHTPTPPPTPVSTTSPAEFRGLVPNAYWVEGAPGPFGVDKEIWFNLDITNSTSGTVGYQALGTWVEETGQFQKSWTQSAFGPGQRFTWRDHINIPTPGAYHLWLAIQFNDGAGVKLRGPIAVTVQ